MASLRPVIIIAAPRSGTNLLRDLLCALPGFGTWPCDEINQIWRHGNARHPSDELPAALARPRVRRYIRGKFAVIGRRPGVEHIVEKTCANSLRVPFVGAVLPEARYLFLRRDGLDAVRSAIERWHAPIDLSYVLRKARFVPLLDAPYHAGRYLMNRLRRLASRDGRLSTWGPRLADMDALVASRPIEEVCALQWRRCVESAAAALAELPASRVHGLEYEALVTAPEQELDRVCAFLGVEVEAERLRLAVRGVSPDRVGAGRRELDPEVIARIVPLLVGAGVR